MTILNWSGTVGNTTFIDTGSPTDPIANVNYPVTGVRNTDIWNGGGTGTLNGTSSGDLFFLDYLGYSTPRLVGIVEFNGGNGNDLIDISSERFAYEPINAYGGEGDDWIFGNEGSDTIYGENGNDRVKGYAGDDTLYGGAGNDQIFGGKGNDFVDGGEGVDSAYFSGRITDYTISKTATGYTIEDKIGSDGIDTLENVERAVFSGKRVAFDMGADQSGGKTVLLMATCLGSDSLSTQSAVVDTLLSFFDAGNTLDTAASTLVTSGIAAQLAGGSDNKQFVDWIGHNVLGSAFTADIENACLSYVSQNGQANFMATVAGFGLNIDLVGLQQTGIEYA
jgi:Ca2+-binding RTX toxin-like protein